MRRAMMRTNGLRCCMAGALLASVSWAVVFMLYQNIDTFQFGSNEPRRLKLVARHQAVAPSSHLQITLKPRRQDRPDRDGNRPNAFFKQRQSESQYDAQYLEVREGQLNDAVLASRIDTASDQVEHDKGFKRHAFNEYLSNRLTFHRPIADTRDSRCSSLLYNTPSLPRVSIVMCFYNEAFSVLLRSLHSILDRTEQSLLSEVILVDDNSDDVELKEKLERYVSHNFGSTVRIVRNEKREGLIRSRMIGARRAASKVLVFLDSHIEANVGWLEPLVERVSMTQNTVVLPIIDIIDSDTLRYKSSPLVRGGFTWSMRFSWEPIPSSVLEEQPLYVSSPTMAGGLLAVDREFFFKLGGYDEGMDIWGGENIEMSLRTWLCGGQIEIAVCSRVGHIFRKTRPYSAPNGEDTMTKNTLRMVHVWLGDNQEKFYTAVGNRFPSINYGDISSRLELKESLKCRDFSWYLENIYDPDNKDKSVRQLPQVKQAPRQAVAGDSGKRGSVLNIIKKGKLKLTGSNLCMEPGPSADGQIVPNVKLKLSECTTVKNKWYELSEGGFLVGKNQCLDVVSNRATITKCTAQGGSQQWIHQTSTEMSDGSGLLYNPSSGLCLLATPDSQVGSQVGLSRCDTASKFIYVVKSK